MKKTGPGRPQNESGNAAFRTIVHIPENRSGSIPEACGPGDCSRRAPLFSELVKIRPHLHDHPAVSLAIRFDFVQNSLVRLA